MNVRISRQVGTHEGHACSVETTMNQVDLVLQKGQPLSADTMILVFLMVSKTSKIGNNADKKMRSVCCLYKGV